VRTPARSVENSSLLPLTATNQLEEENEMDTTVPIFDSSDDLLTLPEVAARLRVPVNTVRWWRQQGTGPAFFKVGRRLVTTVGDLQRWIETQKLEHGPQPAALLGQHPTAS
jgi:hypothetical protein